MYVHIILEHMLAFRHNMDEGEKIFPPASKRGDTL